LFGSRQTVTDLLHLDRLDDWLRNALSTPYGQDDLRLHPVACGAALSRRIAAASAWQRRLAIGDAPDLNAEADLRPALGRLGKGGTLDLLALRDLRAGLTLLDRLAGHPAEERAIDELTEALGDYGSELDALLLSVGADANLLDSASPALPELRRALDQAKAAYRNAAQQAQQTLDEAGMLQDRYVTQRDDRHVLPVKAAHKRRIGGVQHGRSNSGATAYVEPAAMDRAARSVRLAEENLDEEVARILAALSDRLRPRIAELGEDLKVLGQLDTDRARGLFGLRFDGTAPAYDSARIAIDNCRPPALLLIGAEPVIPVDLNLHKDHPVLVISGPNGGGKSVALTAFAWCFELSARGVPIPARSVTLPAPPYQPAIVVGDAANDSDGDSTFSGHLNQVKRAIDPTRSGQRIVFIDELGGGTEPVAGNALACAVVERLADQGDFALVTTHYEGLKDYALTDERLRVAAVRDRSDPTVAFRLFADEVGGSDSLGLAVALGLDDKLLASAQRFLDPGRAKNLENLGNLRTRLTEAEARERQLEETTRRLHDQAEAQRHTAEQQATQAAKLKEQKSKLDARRAEQSDRAVDERLGQLDALKDELRETLKHLREAGEESIAQRGDSLFADLAGLRKQTRAAAPKTERDNAPAAAYKPGDRVRIFGGRQVGVVEELRGEQIMVRANEKILHLPAGLIEPVT
jgi:DNA mismatch repair protein MutS2